VGRRKTGIEEMVTGKGKDCLLPKRRCTSPRALGENLKKSRRNCHQTRKPSTGEQGEKDSKRVREDGRAAFLAKREQG